MGWMPVLEKLKQALSGHRESPAFRVPGQIHDSSRVLVLVDADLAALQFHAPLLAAMRRRWPGASIDFLVPEAFAPLVIPSGLARQVLVYGEKQLSGWKPAYRSLQRSLAQTGYDVAMIVANEPCPALENLALGSGAAMRLGPSHDGAWPAINLELRAGDGTRYHGDRMLQLAPFLGLEDQPFRTAWPLPRDKVRQVAQLVHFNKPRPDEWLVGIDPGPDRSGRAVSPQNLLFIAGQLKTQVSCRILPLCVPGQEDRRARLESELTSPVPPAFNRDTLLDTLLLVAQCDLFLAGNTDLLHLAVARRVPTVGLFGSHVEPAWEPTGARAAMLRIARGEKVDIATLMDTVGEVTRDAGPGDAAPDGGADDPDLAPGSGPLPAPGA
ncbi:hypothetical protein GF314_11150 [bacterium]|nr:hypothetical protein [bacterium]